MSNQYKRESFEAGAKAYANGESSYTPYLGGRWDLMAFRAGWYDAADRAVNPPTDWDDVPATLPKKAAK